MFVSNLVARPYFGSIDIVPFNPKWELEQPLKFDHPYLRINLFNDGDNTIYLKTADLARADLAREAIGEYPESGITAQTIAELAAMGQTPLHQRMRKERERAILAEWRSHDLLKKMAEFFLEYHNILEPHRIASLHLLERAIKGNNNLVHLRGPFASNQPEKKREPRNRTPKSQRVRPDPPVKITSSLGTEPGRGWLSKDTSFDGLADGLGRHDDRYY